MMNRAAILASLRAEVWAIEPGYLEWMMSTLTYVDAKQTFSPGAPVEVYGLVAREQRPAPAAVGVIPVHGPISRRETLWTQLFGGATTEAMAAQLGALIDNPAVKTIVLDMDSPGGTVNGIQELGDSIRQARRQKPVIAVANDLMASAAYWLGAQASDLVVTPSAMVGSVGVFALHADMSGALSQAGIKPTFIQFGENKTLGNPYEPLSGPAQAEIQKHVDEAGHAFVRAVAEGRRTTQTNVMETFGQGLMFSAADAVKRGMADRQATWDEVMAGLGVETRRAALRRDVARAALVS